MTRGDDLIKEILKIFESLRYKRDLWSLYSDFLEMTAIAISNSAERFFLPGSFEKREERYLSLAKSYDKDELLKMSEAFNLFVKLQDYNLESQGAKDILGGILMDLGLGDKWAGQFFTPDHVANLMAKLTYTEEGLKKEIKERGFVYVSDPAVGGGVTMIGLVNAMLDGGCNPQRDLFIECGDLDKRACFMTYIQLATLGIPAIVKNQDTLLGKVFDVWFTPAFYIDGWWFRLKSFKDKEKGGNLAKSKEIFEKREEIIYKEDEQLSLF
ncbi:hypothetical protein [uncultured Anaerococcus sp.]|uniref:hypothetical protein n=1 Tax=uncultured Anaerococcus sp. TaxID=293428 RepID=UPI00288A3583|nr:hypothetical protein [uncultured Anaerococcus sp.]